MDPYKIEKILKVSCPESSTTREKTVMEKIITGQTAGHSGIRIFSLVLHK